MYIVLWLHHAVDLFGLQLEVRKPGMKFGASSSLPDRLSDPLGDRADGPTERVCACKAKTKRLRETHTSTDGQQVTN